MSIKKSLRHIASGFGFSGMGPEGPREKDTEEVYEMTLSVRL